MDSPAKSDAQRPGSKKSTSTSRQSHRSALSDRQGNQEGSHVHQQSPGQHNTLPRENVDNVVVPINVPQHQQESPSQPVTPFPQALNNLSTNSPAHDHHNSAPGFDDMDVDGLLIDILDHIDALPEQNPLFGNSPSAGNNSHAHGHALAQAQHYQQGEQFVVDPPPHQSMMNHHGIPHQQLEVPHPYGAHQLQQPALAQHFDVPNGHAHGVQHPFHVVDHQIQGQVQGPVQHHVSDQHQAQIEQQAFIQYLAYLQHQDHLQHQAYLEHQAYLYLQHQASNNQQMPMQQPALIQHPAPVQHQVPEVPVPVPVPGAAGPAGDHGPPTPHPEANHPSVMALHDVDDLDVEDVREIIRAAAAVLYAGNPQCRKMFTNDFGVEVRCTACA